jgi:hypothetical protein
VSGNDERLLPSESKKAFCALCPNCRNGDVYLFGHGDGRYSLELSWNDTHKGIMTYLYDGRITYNSISRLKIMCWHCYHIITDEMRRKILIDLAHTYARLRDAPRG